MNDFEKYWAVHHPHDWCASERKGKPFPSFDRLLIWEIAKAAYEAGARDGVERDEEVTA